MLIDDVIITVRAGSGGNGKMSLKRNGQTAKGGPDGGNGGNGGNVYIQGTTDLTALSQFQFKKTILAEDGIGGGKNKMDGRTGKDTTFIVPIGTHVIDLESNETLEISDTSSHVLFARGGKGGRGNTNFKSPTDQTPRYAERGEKGEEKKVKLELKLIAQVGLIGLPNAGKSSLLEALTNATPKIGNYPFTTLEPNLGVLDGLILADIPGLIEGASSGKGLGTKFLKHIVKTKVLVHCIDASSHDVLASYRVVRGELEKHNPGLLKKKEIVLLTKTDLVSESDVKNKMKMIGAVGEQVLAMSIYDDASLEKLKSLLTT